MVTPEPDNVLFPGLLDFPAPRLRVYPIYTVIAEKLEALISRGEPNTRMKDFYDLWFLSRRFDLDGDILKKAVLATFERRGSRLKPLGEIEGLSPSFIAMRNANWLGFIGRNRVAATEFFEVVAHLRGFVSPLLPGVQLEGPLIWRASTARWGA